MEYRAADRIGRTSLSQLTARLMLKDDKSFGGALGTAAKMKMAAVATRLQSKVDPLNLVRMLTFNSPMMTAAAGKLFGRSKQSISYFTGGRYGNNMFDNENAGQNRDGSKSDNRDGIHRTKIGPGKTTPIKVGDGTADLLAKLYNLTRAKIEYDLKMQKITKSFSEEQQEEYKRFMEELFGNKEEDKEEEKKEEVEKKKGFFSFLLDGLGIFKTLFTTVKDVTTTIAATLLSFLKHPAVRAFGVVAAIAGTVYAIKEQEETVEENKKFIKDNNVRPPNEDAKKWTPAEKKTFDTFIKGGMPIKDEEGKYTPEFMKTLDSNRKMMGGSGEKTFNQLSPEKQKELFKNQEAMEGQLLGSVADRHNNPGNIIAPGGKVTEAQKKFGGIPGETILGPDGIKRTFVKFPDKEQGRLAAEDLWKRKYGDMPLSKAILAWGFGSKYKDPSELSEKDFKDYQSYLKIIPKDDSNDMSVPVPAQEKATRMMQDDKLSKIETTDKPKDKNFDWIQLLDQDAMSDKLAGKIRNKVNELSERWDKASKEREKLMDFTPKSNIIIAPQTNMTSMSGGGNMASSPVNRGVAINTRDTDDTISWLRKRQGVFAIT